MKLNNVLKSVLVLLLITSISSVSADSDVENTTNEGTTVTSQEDNTDTTQDEEDDSESEEENDSDEDTESNDSEKMDRKEAMKAKHAEMKEKMEAQRAELKEAKEAHKMDAQEKREQMKQNRADFRSEYKPEIKSAYKELSEEQKTALKELRESHKEEMKSLLDQLKEAKGDKERVEEIREEITQLVQEHIADVKEIVGSDSNFAMKVGQAFDARKQVRTTNNEMRSEIRESRKELIEKRKAKIEKYRTTFIKKIGHVIDKAPADKLQKISERIDVIYDKIESNTRMSESKKEAQLSQLVALQDMIEERLENDELDIEAIFDVED